MFCERNHLLLLWFLLHWSPPVQIAMQRNNSCRWTCVKTWAAAAEDSLTPGEHCTSAAAPPRETSLCLLWVSATMKCDTWTCYLRQAQESLRQMLLRLITSAAISCWCGCPAFYSRAEFKALLGESRTWQRQVEGEQGGLQRKKNSLTHFMPFAEIAPHIVL